MHTLSVNTYVCTSTILITENKLLFSFKVIFPLHLISWSQYLLTSVDNSVATNFLSKAQQPRSTYKTGLNPLGMGENAPLSTLILAFDPFYFTYVMHD